MKSGKTEPLDLDIAGLLALKTYERPDADRTEKNIQNIMREVRSASNKPALLLFPDKGFSWMFTRPRYGIAALFILFLGLHLIDRPVPAVPVGTAILTMSEPVTPVIASVETNRVKTVIIPGVNSPPAYYAPSLAGNPRALLTSYNE